MKTQAKNTLIEKMERTEILVEKELTAQELTDQFLGFSEMMVRLVMDGENLESVRLDEIIFRMEAAAREKGLVYDKEVRQAIQSLREINKNLKISVAGRKGEERVQHVMNYVTRPDFATFSNVYIADGESETELDSVILTREGILILEVKNTKKDITITEDGRLLYANQECYHEIGIHQKMKNKRKLLKKKINRILEEKGLDIPICIDSYVVFSVPKEMHIKITDCCQKEPWCFKGSLPFRIDGYHGGDLCTEEQFAQMAEVLGEFGVCQKRFPVPMDFDLVREVVAGALVQLWPEKFDVVAQRVAVYQSELEVRQPEILIVNIEDVEDEIVWENRVEENIFTEEKNKKRLGGVARWNKKQLVSAMGFMAVATVTGLASLGCRKY